MKKRILKTLAFSIAISILVTFVFLLFLMYRQEDSQKKESVKNEAAYLELAMKKSGNDFLDESVGNATSTRITLIDEDGTILFDSVEEPETMENHADRPEIKEALERGRGEETRLSATLGEVTYYYAVRLESGEVLRVSTTSETILVTIKDSIVPLTLIFIVLFIPAVLLANRHTKRMVEPMNDLNLESPLENEVYEELSPLLHRIDKQNKQINVQVKELKEKQEEYLAITENMKDGLIVTSQSSILSINRAAAELFHINKEDCLQKNILTLSRNVNMKECLEEALAGRHSSKMILLKNKNYQLIGNPVRVDAVIKGAVIFVLDVTEKAAAEQMRREFSANVSHELKTPLMSIMGYAELMVNHMVKPADMDEFANRIYKESKRLADLVADIIKLSRLDEEEHPLIMEEVDLWSVAEDVREHLSAAAEKKKVHIRMEGRPVKVSGNPQMVYEILYNLCDNAIKYNKEDGKVKIILDRKDRTARMSVSDTGIGIPKEEQERIFERFYRVDKSRSRQEGGTGLGLSIVKHGVMIHKGNIVVESEPGQGTVITVELPLAESEK